MSNIFGNLSSQTQQASSVFGKPATSSLFGSTTSQPQQSGSVFGSTAPQPQQSNLFGSTASQPQQAGSLFGTTMSQPQQTGSIFGNGASNQAQAGSNIFGNLNTSQPQPSSLLPTLATQQPQQGSVFGSTATQPQQNTSIFGNLGSNTTTSNQQQGGGLFGNLGSNANQNPQQGTSLFANLGQNTQQQQQQPQQGASLFANLGQNSQQQQTQQGASLFGNLGQNTQQQQQQQQQQQLQQQQQQQGSIFGQSQANRIWAEPDATPRQRSVGDQIQLVCSKWDPSQRNSLFHTYLYNQVDPAAAPFYRPDPSEDEEKWEEALRKAPSPGSIPILVKGFYQLGQRVIGQGKHLDILHGRLYEINNGLTTLLRKHELEISTRTTECRRRHIRLSQKCLALATKTQVLRNRGYAMDGAEEELRQKLTALEKNVFDPALNGRGEEIWARMVNVRERGRQLEAEFERAGTTMSKEEGSVIDEGTMKRAKKILEDYDSQLSHLAKELDQIRKEWAEWEQSKTTINGSGRR